MREVVIDLEESERTQVGVMIGYLCFDIGLQHVAGMGYQWPKPDKASKLRSNNNVECVWGGLLCWAVADLFTCGGSVHRLVSKNIFTYIFYFQSL